jgi:hypothetical protein
MVSIKVFLGREKKGATQMGQSRYPLDFEALEKGMTIEALELERIFGISRNDRMYAVKLMSLCNEIEKRSAEAGAPLHTKSEKGAIKILTDEEDSLYQSKRFKEGIDQSFRAQHKALVIDTENLSEPRKIAHERNIQKQAFVLASIVSARRQLKAHERSGKNVPSIQSENHGDRAIANALTAGGKSVERVVSADEGDQQQTEKE